MSTTRGELIPGPAMVKLARKWSGRPGFTPYRLTYYVRTGVVPRPIVEGYKGRAAQFDWSAAVTLKVVLELLRRGLPLQRYRKGLALLQERFPELADRPSLRFMTDGRELIVIDGADDEKRAWELVNRAGKTTGQGVSPQLLELDLASMRNDVVVELDSYRKRQEARSDAARDRATARWDATKQRNGMVRSG